MTINKLARCLQCGHITDSKYLVVGQKFQCLCGHWNTVQNVQSSGNSSSQNRSQIGFCETCFTKVPVGSECKSCLVRVELPPPPVGRAKLDCVVCGDGTMLHSHRFAEAGFSVSECHSCGGVWIDVPSFERFLGYSRRQAEKFQASMVVPRSPELETERPSLGGEVSGAFYRKCLVCKNLMNRENFGSVSGVVMDVCKGHGVWLDANELGRIYLFVLKQERQRYDALLHALR